MNKNNIKEQLLDYMSGLTIIDCHEHLMPEEYHLNYDYNFFHLMMPYVQWDLASAGMPTEWVWNEPKSEKDIERYWNKIVEVWPYVEQGSYAKVVSGVLKEFWGINNLTKSSWQEIGSLMKATRVKGHYEEIIKDKCNIKYILNQAGMYSFKDDYLKGNILLDGKGMEPTIRQFIKDNGDEVTLEDYILSVKKEIEESKREGAVLAKYAAYNFKSIPNKEKAFTDFEKVKTDEDFHDVEDIGFYLYDETLNFVEEMKMVAAVHTGVWTDIREKNPEHVFGAVERHPNLKFDIYHMGMPYVRECGFLGKNYQNAYLNLCWSHIVSPRMLINALDEWLDYVPINKVFAFGGDHATMPENIWIHLNMARNNFAEVFANKIMREEMNLDTAKYILKLWFYDNPTKVYQL